jgi:hypothetical protein
MGADRFSSGSYWSMADFDPYYTWLGIPPKDQPPTHYRLLGVECFEANSDVIENAADRQMAHVRLNLHSFGSFR